MVWKGSERCQFTKGLRHIFSFKYKFKSRLLQWDLSTRLKLCLSADQNIDTVLLWGQNGNMGRAGTDFLSLPSFLLVFIIKLETWALILGAYLSTPAGKPGLFTSGSLTLFQDMGGAYECCHLYPHVAPSMLRKQLRKVWIIGCSKMKEAPRDEKVVAIFWK